MFTCAYSNIVYKEVHKEGSRAVIWRINLKIFYKMSKTISDREVDFRFRIFRESNVLLNIHEYTVFDI